MPEDAIFVQGSALRVENLADIGDLDIAIRVDAKTFDDLMSRFISSTTSLSRKEQIKTDAAKGIIKGTNMFLDSNNSFTGSFYKKFLENIKIDFLTKYPTIKNIQISIIKENGQFDISPYLKLK